MLAVFNFSGALAELAVVVLSKPVSNKPQIQTFLVSSVMSSSINSRFKTQCGNRHLGTHTHTPPLCLIWGELIESLCRKAEFKSSLGTCTCSFQSLRLKWGLHIWERKCKWLARNIFVLQICRKTFRNAEAERPGRELIAAPVPTVFSWHPA